MDEQTAVRERISVNLGPKKCSHCHERPSNPKLHSRRDYCEPCWDEMNRKKSATMLAKGIKRSFATKARMSASKRVKRAEDPAKWKLYFQFYKDQLEIEQQLNARIARLGENSYAEVIETEQNITLP